MILQTSVRKQPRRQVHVAERRTNWRIGVRLVGFASYERLSGDRDEIARATPTLRRYVTARRAPAAREPERPPPTRALLLRRRRTRLRPPHAGGRVAGAPRHGERVARNRLPQPRGRGDAALGEAPARAAARRSPLRASAARRLAVRPGTPARARLAVPLGDPQPPGELLEPRHAVRARDGPLPAGQHAGARRPALPRHARGAAARSRAHGRVRAVRPAARRSSPARTRSTD